jgi:hypothetical protein
MNRKAGLYRRGLADRGVNPAKVVIREEQAKRRFVVSRFFESASVSRVSRRICMRLLRLCRST